MRDLRDDDSRMIPLADASMIPTGGVRKSGLTPGLGRE
jgi:hypothetical protein